MKEVTEWDGKPRWMWVWDDAVCEKTKLFVVCILTEKEMEEANYSTFPVFTSNRTSWKHCAEIDEPQSRRMTKRELSWWLRDHPEEHREWTNKDGCVVYSAYVYAVDKENEPCSDNILIRSNGGEWREPLKECEE